MIPDSVAMDPILEGRDISKQFGGLTALSQIDFIVYPGEIVGLIGPNGSGKTTLVDCLSRMQDVSHGSIIFKGVEITKARPFRVARMGFARTFQVVRVYREMTVIDNMLLSRQWRRNGFLAHLQRSPKELSGKALEILDFLTLADKADEHAGNLSVGQQRLLEIGMALMPDPELIFFDEAMAGINPALVRKIKDRIRELNHKSGVTIALIEHNMHAIGDLCGRIYVLDRGEMLAEGTPEEVFGDERVVEAYLGTRVAGPEMTRNE